MSKLRTDSGSVVKEKDILEYMRRVHDGELEAHFEPLVHAEGDTCYAFSYAEDSDKGRDWRADGYRWRHNGVKKMTVEDVVIKKSYFNIYTGPKQTSKRFQRISYECNEYPFIVIILYKGDHTIAGSFPHGNRRRDSRPYVMTLPSIIAACKTVTGNPKAVYEGMVASAPDSIISRPRDAAQIQNLQKTMRNKQRRTVEALDIMQELSFDMQLTYEVVADPDLVILLFNEKVLEQVSTVLCHQPEAKTQTLAIYPMIQYEHYVVVSLLYQNHAYSKSPLIPIMFFLHEKDLAMPETFVWHECRRKIPKLDNAKNLELTGDVNDDLADDVRTRLKTDMFQEIVGRLEEWDKAPVDAMLHLQKNAMKLYELSVHFASKLKGANTQRQEFRAKYENIFGLSERGCVGDGTVTDSHNAYQLRRHKLASNFKMPSSGPLLDKARSIKKANIKLNVETRCFDVKDGNATRSVTLFPEETCTCNASGVCRHILACKCSLQMCEYPKEVSENPADTSAAEMDEESFLYADSVNDEHILELVECRDDDLDAMDISEEVTITDESNLQP